MAFSREHTQSTSCFAIRLGPLITLGFMAFFLLSGSVLAAGFDLVPRDHWAYGSLRAITTSSDVRDFLEEKLGGDRPVLKYNFAVAIGKVITRGGQTPPWEVINTMSLADLQQLEKIIPFFMEELENLDFQPAEIVRRISLLIKTREKGGNVRADAVAGLPKSGNNGRNASPPMSRIRVLKNSDSSFSGKVPLEVQESQSGMKILPGDGREAVVSRSLRKDGLLRVVRLKISPSTARVQAGQRVQFRVFGIYSDNSIKPVDVRTTVDKPLGTMAPDNTFSAVRTGTGTVAAFHPESNLSAAAEILVLPGEISRISVEPSEANLHQGQVAKFSAQATDRFGNRVEHELMWKATGDCGKAGSGTFLALSPGTGTLYATSADGRVFDTARVNVLPMAVKSVEGPPSREMEQALSDVRNEILRRDREQTGRIENLKEELKREMAGVIGQEFRMQRLSMEKRAVKRDELARTLARQAGESETSGGGTAIQDKGRSTEKTSKKSGFGLSNVSNDSIESRELLNNIRDEVNRAVEIGSPLEQSADSSQARVRVMGSGRKSGKKSGKNSTGSSRSSALKNQRNQLSSKGVRIFRLRNMESGELVRALSSGIFGAPETLKWMEDPRTNTVTVSAPVMALETLSRYLMVTDIPSRQVRIEARILEVTLGDRDSMGVDWTMLLPSGGAPKSISDENAIKVSMGGPGGDGAATLRFGTLTTEQFQAVLSRLSETERVKLVSNPSITTVSGKKASILVGQVFPIARWTVNETTGKYEIIGYDEKKVGIKLEVTPTVTESGVVKLKVEPKVEDIVNFVGQFNERPVTFTRSADTEVEIRDTQTLVIGGMIRESSDIKTTRVPILGEIPGIKHLFQKRTRFKERKETVIFITPSVVTNEDQGRN